MKDLEQDIIDLFQSYNIHIHSNNGNEMNVFCPFHKNQNSAAMYINVRTGLWQCFNPSCAKKGNFRQLYFALTGKNYGKSTGLDKFALQKELDGFVDSVNRSIDIDIESIIIDYDTEQSLLSTITERGLDLDTLKYFEVGYSKNKNRVVIPVRSVWYELVGFIGRAVDSSQEPRYLYNKGFKRADHLFNLQNAKKYDSCIIVEGSIDCMFVHQSGFPNVVATLGAAVPASQIALLKKYFDKIIIFSDNDDAGTAMRRGIIEQCVGKEISVALIPEGFKDPAEMPKDKIQQTIQKATKTI
jgi:DNA primase